MNKLLEKTEPKSDNFEKNIDNLKEEKDIDLLVKEADSLRESQQYQEALIYKIKPLN